MQIGDKLWCNDSRSHTKPWFEAEITGETRQSWLLGRVPYKVNKKTLLENLGQWGNRRWHTRDSMAEHRWMNDHRWKIAKQVEACRDAKVLYQVAQILGYEVSDPVPENQ